jgi:hypothetical protein
MVDRFKVWIEEARTLLLTTMFDVYLSDRRSAGLRKGFLIPLRCIIRQMAQEQEAGTRRQRGDQARRSAARLLHAQA